MNYNTPSVNAACMLCSPYRRPNVFKSAIVFPAFIRLCQILDLLLLLTFFSHVYPLVGDSIPKVDVIKCFTFLYLLDELTSSSKDDKEPIYIAAHAEAESLVNVP